MRKHSSHPAGPRGLDEAVIAEALEARGYAVIDEALPRESADNLLAHLHALGTEAFIRAGLGREADYRRSAAVRGDLIHWLDPEDKAAAAWFARMESLRAALNRRLFLGLFDYECHYARYPAGAFYRKHLDAFKGGDNRVVSTVLYLNPDWEAEHGGELLLYDRQERPLEQLAPLFNRLVLFLSADFPHEVLPAARERCSLAGWFRINGSRGDRIDPPR